MNVTKNIQQTRTTIIEAALTEHDVHTALMEYVVSRAGPDGQKLLTHTGTHTVTINERTGEAAVCVRIVEEIE
jgi:hypothetical protein